MSQTCEHCGCVKPWCAEDCWMLLAKKEAAQRMYDLLIGSNYPLPSDKT